MDDVCFLFVVNACRVPDEDEGWNGGVRDVCRWMQRFWSGSKREEEEMREGVHDLPYRMGQWTLGKKIRPELH